MRRVIVDECAQGQRLDNYLIKMLKGVPKTHVYCIIRSGQVRVNKRRPAADTRLAWGDEIRIPPVRVSRPSGSTLAPSAPAREFTLVWEDEFLIALDKPAGVAVHGGSGVRLGVIEQMRQTRPQAKFLELVHRLDKDTSGLLLVAKKRAALIALQDQFRKRAAGKTYVALVNGVWPSARKVIDASLLKYLDAAGERRVRVVSANNLDARRSISLVRVISTWPSFSLIEVTIKTGRTHQIRVHLAHEGHSVAGDPKYGDFSVNRALARGEAVPGQRLSRMFLHARRLSFAHPGSGNLMELEAPLPGECAALVAALTQVGSP